MSVMIELYKAIGNGPNLTLGPFRNVAMRHRSLEGDGVVVALRHFDGLWRLPTGSSGAGFLAARVAAAGRSGTKLRFVQGWKSGSDFERAIREIRLQGDLMYLGSQATPFAETLDEERIWQTWADGLAYDAAILAA
jgi:hypothetical protein